MDEFTNKGLESKGCDAEIPKRRIEKTPRAVASEEYAIKRLEDMELNGVQKSSIISRMVVEGYDTSPDSLREDVEEALRKHLASRGIKLIHASVPVVDDGDRPTLCRCALVYINRECEAEALKLHGSYMGGRILEISPYPFDDNRLDHVFAPTKAPDKLLPRRLLKVKGVDTSLAKDDDDIKKMFRVVFPRSTCHVFPDSILLDLGGQDAIDKAMKLSGGSVEGFQFAVDAVGPLIKMPGGFRSRTYEGFS